MSLTVMHLQSTHVMPVLHQTVLFVHVMAFAISVSAVLREDWRLLRTRHVNPVRLRPTMRTVLGGLALLWLSGLALVAVDVAAASGPWRPSAKLSAKLWVVTVLTLNGWALHAWVFPRLRPGPAAWQPGLRVAAVFGAVSSASWLFAAFIGVARPLAPMLTFSGFMAGHTMLVAVACLVVRTLFSAAPGGVLLAPAGRQAGVMGSTSSRVRDMPDTPAIAACGPGAPGASVNPGSAYRS